MEGLIPIAMAVSSAGTTLMVLYTVAKLRDLALASRGSEPASSDDDGGLSPDPAVTMADIPVSMSRRVRARERIARDQHWTSSACRYTRKRASLGEGSSASSEAELRL